MTDVWDGRPQNPERDGWHWLRGRPNGEPEPLFWFDETDGDGDGFGWQLSYGVGTPERVSRIFDYLGPCPQPDEVAARVAEARREALEEAAQTALRLEVPEDAGPIGGHARVMASVQIAATIRALKEQGNG